MPTNRLFHFLLLIHGNKKNRVILFPSKTPMPTYLKHIAALLLLSLLYASNAQDQILTFRKEGRDFDDAYKGLQQELKNEFIVKNKFVSKKSVVEDIIVEMKTQKPKLVVLMDNTSIALFKKYQETLPQGDSLIPSISLMGVMVKEAISNIKNSTGIAYEIPIVTSVIAMREIFGKPIKKIGVLYRAFLEDFFNLNNELCKREGIELIGMELPNKCDSYKTTIKTALKTLPEEKKIESLWILNYNILLQPSILTEIWMPVVKKATIPVIVGVEILVQPQLDFGTFAVIPDHIAMGSQAAEMIYDIKGNNWLCKEKKVEQPLAVFKIINFYQAKRKFNIPEENLRNIDKKLK
jgi:hypothetical protein